MRRALFASAVSVALLVPVAGCKADVLSLGAASSMPPAIDKSVRMMDLTDDQASQVCAWLISAFPEPNMVPMPLTPKPEDSDAPGYVNGATTGVCAGLHPGGGALFWVVLAPSQCELNLRHSPCGASLGSLESCVHAFDMQIANENSGYGQVDCGTLQSACADYESAPSCDETVFQTHEDPGPDLQICGTSLPIRSGVTCPASSVLDAGAD
jgi:hypothetical protein